MPCARLIRSLTLSLFVCGLHLAGAPALAQEKILNLYSARHYQTDEALYADFTRATGIRIRRIDADDAGLLARLKTEGASSPADVILLVDAARLWRGEIEGLFQPVRSPLLEKAVPTHLRSKDSGSGSQWFGFSTRTRLIVIRKGTVKREETDTWEKLADPRLRGRICMRSGAHPYNLSLFGSLLEHWGEARTQEWMKGLLANLARAPKGGDTDQLRAVGAGECDVAISNSYYVARLARSAKPEDQALMQQLAVIVPNQGGFGAHMNIAGGAMARHAPHREEARRFLEYLASPSAQRYFADGNDEWPVVEGVSVSNPALVALGRFKPDPLSVSAIGMNQVRVQQMLDRLGFK